MVTLMPDELKRVRMAIARGERDARRHPGDEEAKTRVAKLRAEYAELKIQEYVKRVVANAPPLSKEQRARLATLLRDDSVPGR